MADSTPTARALPLGCRRIFFFSSRRRHTRSDRDWSSDVCFFRSREKAHTREGDAIAAARRRLPMVEVDGATPLVGERGALTLLDAFEGRRMLIAYYCMWHTGDRKSTRLNSSHDQISYAVFCLKKK